jgi:hypothetical protein
MNHEPAVPSSRIRYRHMSASTRCTRSPRVVFDETACAWPRGAQEASALDLPHQLDAIEQRCLWSPLKPALAAGSFCHCPLRVTVLQVTRPATGDRHGPPPHLPGGGFVHLPPEVESEDHGYGAEAQGHAPLHARVVDGVGDHEEHHRAHQLPHALHAEHRRQLPSA